MHSAKNHVTVESHSITRVSEVRVLPCVHVCRPGLHPDCIDAALSAIDACCFLRKSGPSLLVMTPKWARDKPAPMAPQLLGPVGGDLKDAGCADAVVYVPFGMGGNFGSFLQNLDELPAFFNADFGPSFDPETR